MRKDQLSNLFQFAELDLYYERFEAEINVLQVFSDVQGDATEREIEHTCISISSLTKIC